VQLVVRSTDYNRFQEKVRKGNVQLFRWGWNADYPDPENMLFLLHGPQGKVKASGENAANYVSPEFDAQFEMMKNMENGPDRQAIIDRMVGILRQDAPWIFGFHPMSYTLTHEWMKNRKPNKVAHNTLKYQRIDSTLREKRRAEWNNPVLWPVFLGVFLIAGFCFLAWRHYQTHEKQVAR
jgi:ABC-type oligopeptide transport system substrate-binding subunit